MAAFFKILIYGYGNPGRADDGLGNELVNHMKMWTAEKGIEGIEFDSNYQLNIEDAEAIAGKDLVVFADASSEEIEDIAFTEVTGERDVAFTSHAASPGYIVKLCHDLFGKSPEVYLLHIKGYCWEFEEGLSDRAKENLEKAVNFLSGFLLHRMNDDQK